MANYTDKKDKKTVGVADRAMRTGESRIGRKRGNLPNNRIEKAGAVFAPYDSSVWDDVINYPVPTLGPGYYNGVLDNKISNYIPGSNVHPTVVLAPVPEAKIAANAPILAHFHFWPTMGANTNDNHDPLNLVAEVVYRYISNVQRGGAIVTKYNRLDVIIYLFCISQIIMMCRWLEFIIKCGCSQMTTNNVMPLAYFKAIDLTTIDGTGGPMDAFDEIANNIEDARSKIKYLNTRLATLIIPDGLPIMEQWTKLIQAFYADSENVDVAQLYSFSPEGYYIYDERIEDPEEHTWTGAKAKWVSIGNRILSWMDIYNIINDMIDAMVTNSDVVFQIGSDIQTAYGTDDFWHPEIEVPEEETKGQAFRPVYYSEDVLLALRNANIVNGVREFNYSIQVNPHDYTKGIKLWGRPQIDYNTLSNPSIGASIPCIPLQFASKPSKQQVATALKWHPMISFMQVADAEGDDTVCVDFGAAYGTEFLTQMTFVWKDPTVNGIANSTVYSVEKFGRALLVNDVTPLIISLNYRNFPPFVAGAFNHVDNKYTLTMYSGDRDYEMPITYEQALKYCTGFTRFAWGAEQNASSKGLYSASQRKQIG